VYLEATLLDHMEYMVACIFSSLLVSDWLEECRPWKSWKTNWEAVWYPYRGVCKGKIS